MRNSHTITVRYNATESSLQIKPAGASDLILEADTSPIHSVRWRFEGIDGLVAAGWLPGIRFAVGPKKSKVPQYSGPFSNLTTTKSTVIASGNSGKGGRYRYMATIKPPIGSGLSEIRTGKAYLYNQVTERTPAVIKVRPPANKKGLWRVEPEAVTCAAGQSILWEVDAPPKEIGSWYPRLAFYDGPEGMNSRLGPFSSLDTRNKSILASGSGAQSGRYSYVFQLVSLESGEVRFKSSPDPTVDDEGDPSGGN